MSGSGQRFDNQFNRADVNHDGTIDEQEFRQFLGPVIKDQRRLSGSLSPQEAQAFVISFRFNSNHFFFFSFVQSGSSETITYPVGLDVAVAGFTQNPIAYEKYTGGAVVQEDHRYGLGPDVGIGAPNVARKSNQYDPAGAMFNYADVNSDGRIDPQEFGTFMRSV